MSLICLVGTSSLLVCLTHFWRLTLAHLQSNHLPSSYCLLFCLTQFWWLKLAHLQSNHLPSSYCLLFCLTHFWWLKLAHLQSNHLPSSYCLRFSILPTSVGWNLHVCNPIICQIVYLILTCVTHFWWLTFAHQQLFLFRFSFCHVLIQGVCTL